MGREHRASEHTMAVKSKPAVKSRPVKSRSMEHPLVQMQQTAGNQAMLQMLRAQGIQTGPSVIQRAKKPKPLHVYDQSNPKDTGVIPEEGILVKLGWETSPNIGVTSVADMVTKVNAYVDNPDNECSGIRYLEINGHGTDGYQSVGNGDQYVQNDKALIHDSTEAHLQQLAKLKLTSGGFFLMMGCHVGQGENGKKLQGRIAKILPGEIIGGAEHYTAGTGLGNKRVVGEGDSINEDYSKMTPFLTSKYVRWVVVRDGKEISFGGSEAATSEGKAKIKQADKVKVETPEGTVKVK